MLVSKTIVYFHVIFYVICYSISVLTQTSIGKIDCECIKQCKICTRTKYYVFRTLSFAHYNWQIGVTWQVTIFTHLLMFWFVSSHGTDTLCKQRLHPCPIRLLHAWVYIHRKAVKLLGESTRCLLPSRCYLYFWYMWRVKVSTIITGHGMSPSYYVCLRVPIRVQVAKQKQLVLKWL